MIRTANLIIALAISLTISNIGAATVWYVDDDAPGANNGSNWTDAFHHLQDAFAVAGANHEIRVARGTYYPDLGGGNTPGNTDADFALKSKLTIKGGYPGHSALNPDNRDVHKYPTILSGDINDNDGPDFANYNDNTQVIVRAQFIDGSAVLDGFTITGGNGWSGPGMSCYEASPTIRNCSFIRNRSIGREGGIGGAIYNSGSSPTLINCLIAENYAAMMGGGIWNQSGSYPILINCTVAANESPAGGGILGYNSKPVLRNCIVYANTPDSLGDDSYDIQYSNIEGLAPTGTNIDADPRFADLPHSDYLLKSQGGRYNPTTQSWVYDDVSSPCIDAGNPLSPTEVEPFPNGGIVNMGAYGATSEASKSYFGKPPCETIVAGDVNGDCAVNFLDFRLMALHWCEDNNPIGTVSER